LFTFLSLFPRTRETEKTSRNLQGQKAGAGVVRVTGFVPEEEEAIRLLVLVVSAAREIR